MVNGDRGSITNVKENPAAESGKDYFIHFSSKVKKNNTRLNKIK